MADAVHPGIEGWCSGSPPGEHCFSDTFTGQNRTHLEMMAEIVTADEVAYSPEPLASTATTHTLCRIQNGAVAPPSR
jgi:hypothetical protein